MYHGDTTKLLAKMHPNINKTWNNNEIKQNQTIFKPMPRVERY
jgi:hypothetical protein